MSYKFLSTVINIRKHCSPYLGYMYTCNKNVICTNMAQTILLTWFLLMFLKRIQYTCLWINYLNIVCISFFLLRVHADLTLHWILFKKWKFHISRIYYLRLILNFYSVGLFSLGILIFGWYYSCIALKVMPD